MGWTTEQLNAHRAKALDAKVKRRAAALPKETAAQITRNVLAIIKATPKCAAWRINNVGVWDEAKQIRRKGNTQKGIADVSAIIRGRAAWIEVKAGHDKMSYDQLIFKQEVEIAGGLFFEARSTSEFLTWFKNLTP